MLTNLHSGFMQPGFTILVWANEIPGFFSRLYFSDFIHCFPWHHRPKVPPVGGGVRHKQVCTRVDSGGDRKIVPHPAQPWDQTQGLWLARQDTHHYIYRDSHHFSCESINTFKRHKILCVNVCWVNKHIHKYTFLCVNVSCFLYLCDYTHALGQIQAHLAVISLRLQAP